MEKDIVLSSLITNKHLIRKTIKVFNENKVLLYNIVKNTYKKKSFIKKNINNIENNEWIISVLAYSILDVIELNEIINILNAKNICFDETKLNELNYLHQIITNNFNYIIDCDELSFDDDEMTTFEDLLTKEYKKIKYKHTITISITSAFFFVFFSTGIFILVPHWAYVVTPIGSVFNSIHVKLFNQTSHSQYNTSHNYDIEMPGDRDATIKLIHEMSNSLIIAADNNAKRGIVEITPHNVNIAIDAAKTHMDDKDLSYMLDSWRIGNFYNATIVHNYIWNILKGEIGYAIALDEAKIDRITTIHSSSFSNTK